MRLLAALCLISAGAAAEDTETVKEPGTGTTFPATIEVDDTRLACTGAAVRSKFGISVYAIAHYGDPEAAPEAETDQARLKHWIDSKHTRAMVLKFVYPVTAYQMRQAAEESLDKVGYDKPLREKVLDALGQNYSMGAELRLTASRKGALTATLDGERLGQWKDREFVRAMWQAWLGETTVLTSPEKLVQRKIAADAESQT